MARDAYLCLPICPELVLILFTMGIVAYCTVPCPHRAMYMGHLSPLSTCHMTLETTLIDLCVDEMFGIVVIGTEVVATATI